jgi:hypothetical protein
MNMPEDATDPKHPQKLAVDAFGGDPMDPGDSLLETLAAVVKGEKKDDIAMRWARALPPSQPAQPVWLHPCSLNG